MNDKEKELTHIDLFSGIGGFTLAAEWAEINPEYCKIAEERLAQGVL